MGSVNASADVSVRVAWADDADGIAGVQVTAWQALYGELYGDLGLPALDELSATWHRSLTRPGDARNRVLVALERNAVRGFAVTIPSPDPDADPVSDGELADLVVDPAATRLGHGSRLLQAAMDTMRADRFSRAAAWVITTDDVRRTFLTSAGFAPDGAHRELDLHGDGATTVKQVRLHAAL